MLAILSLLSDITVATPLLIVKEESTHNIQARGGGGLHHEGSCEVKDSIDDKADAGTLDG